MKIRRESVWYVLAVLLGALIVVFAGVNLAAWIVRVSGP